MLTPNRFRCLCPSLVVQPQEGVKNVGQCLGNTKATLRGWQNMDHEHWLGDGGGGGFKLKAEKNSALVSNGQWDVGKIPRVHFWWFRPLWIQKLTSKSVSLLVSKCAEGGYISSFQWLYRNPHWHIWPWEVHALPEDESVIKYWEFICTNPESNIEGNLNTCKTHCIQ